jgi:hypothetical protein
MSVASNTGQGYWLSDDLIQAAAKLAGEWVRILMITCLVLAEVNEDQARARLR